MTMGLHWPQNPSRVGQAVLHAQGLTYKPAKSGSVGGKAQSLVQNYSLSTHPSSIPGAKPAPQAPPSLLHRSPAQNLEKAMHML